MGLSQSLRLVMDQIGGTYGDDDYDDFDEDDRVEAPRDVVRPLAIVRPPHVEFAIVAPQDFDGAQQIADCLKANAPVIVDLRGCERDLAERLIDFGSGLTYALGGGLQYVGEQIVLLTPPHVEVSSGSPSGLHERRFFNRA